LHVVSGVASAPPDDMISKAPIRAVTTRSLPPIDAVIEISGCVWAEITSVYMLLVA
jgi:hypothetical protein